jgi:hypothetical protein
MSESVSFKGCSIVSCGTMRQELEQLREAGFLDADRIFYAAPGLHEWPWEYEKQVTRRLRDAQKVSSQLIVVYGARCFVDNLKPERVTDTLIREQHVNAVRIKAANCVDMLASREERERISGPLKVHWLTPGWLKHWDFIFKDWDQGKFNEMFPRHDKAIVLDALGYYDRLMLDSPERVLQISDMMNLPIESYPVTLDRLKELLTAARIRVSVEYGEKVH